MSDLLSFSVLQLISILSFLTSLVAVVCVGSGSLHRLSNKFDFEFGRHAPDVSMATAKQPSWSWSLPSSFSLGALIGDDTIDERSQDELEKYHGGAELVRMDWQLSRPEPVPPIQEPRAPVSMAKLIMSRHSQRKPYRLPRRTPGMPRPTPPSRLMESAV